MAENNFDRAIRVNGFGQSEHYLSSEFLKLSSIDHIYVDKSRIKPIEISSLSDYIKIVGIIVKKQSSYDRPLFFRGHSNVNYLDVPASLRSNDSIEKECFHFEEALLRAPFLFSSCENTMEKLVAMQHYGLGARCLDLTQSPFAALYFACKGNIKFGNPHKNDNMFGTVTMFQPRKDEDNLREDIKYHSSSTVAVLANTANLKKEFYYGSILINYRNDGHQSYIDKDIHFSHLVSHSVIVRVKKNNPRILNQNGLFIVVNANEMMLTSDESSNEISYLMQDILKGEQAELSLNRLGEYHNGTLSNIREWDIKFRKILPYDINNKYEKFRSDPFDLKRLYLKDDDNKRIVFFIAPSLKHQLLEELQNIGITDDFIYPEYDTILTMVDRNGVAF